MRFEKKKISDLTKCYAVSGLRYQGKKHFVVASEKDFPCLLFDEYGAQEGQIWPGTPGGTMSIVQPEGADGLFLATQKFYSPNDSKESKIVLAAPGPDGGWNVRILAELPHVHRFDILRREGRSYLIACTICSGRDFKDDWSHPGKVYGCRLPDDLNGIDAEHPLKLEVLKENLLKNHGYLHYQAGGVESGLVTCESGVYQFTPAAGDGWKIVRLLKEPVSDVCMVDFDGDGADEMVTIGPFHGDTLKIWKEEAGEWRCVYTHSEKLEFAHAIWGGLLCGRPAAVIGYRRGKRELCCFTYDGDKGFSMQVIDSDTGPANVYHDTADGKEILIAANRETDEVALYTVTAD